MREDEDLFDINNRRYTGSKYKLIDWIKNLIEENCPGNVFCDIFAGTGVVTDSVLDIYNKFIINDFLYSNEVIYKGFYLQEYFDWDKIEAYKKKYTLLNPDTLEENYVSINYGDKFFRNEDAKIIGVIREDIENERSALNEKEYYILLASLIYSLDKAANTVGHYDAYIKNKEIKTKFNFELIMPKKLPNKAIHIYRRDANELANEIETDVTFIDPPYNSRQYSRFYHVLENIAQWKKPDLYGIALKPEPENMSEYCKTAAPIVLKDLILKLKTKYIVLTYNNTYNSKSSSSKNKITLEEIEEILNEVGKTKKFEKSHQFFNAGKTEFSNHKEYLFITEVGEK